MRMLHQKLFHLTVKDKPNYFYPFFYSWLSRYKQNQLFLPFFTVGYPDTNEYNVHGYQTTADTYYSYQDLSPYDSYHKVYAVTN